jgi:hypothetical protein
MIQLGCREAAEHGPKIVNIYRAEVNTIEVREDCIFKMDSWTVAAESEV